MSQALRHNSKCVFNTPSADVSSSESVTTLVQYKIWNLTFGQGLETSGRNRFLPGRMEGTGKKHNFFQFLLEKSGKNWKKAEETGKNTCCQMGMQTKCWKEVPR